MKKKVLFLLLCSVLVFNLTGCDNDSNSNPNNNPNNNAANTSNNQENSMINLNDNIEITINTKSTGTANCFFYMFATNLQEVFPTAQIKSTNNYYYVSYWPGSESDGTTGEITEEGLNNNMNSLEFDNDQETALIGLFKQYQNGTYTGMKDVEYSFENHRFSFSYNYLVFKNNDYTSDGTTANSIIQDALTNATKFNGPCGGFDVSDDAVLTENLCDEYNLNCGRW